MLLLLQTEHAMPTGTQQHRLAQLTDLVNSFQHQVGPTAAQERKCMSSGRNCLQCQSTKLQTPACTAALMTASSGSETRQPVQCAAPVVTWPGSSLTCLLTCLLTGM